MILIRPRTVSTGWTGSIISYRIFSLASDNIRYSGGKIAKMANIQSNTDGRSVGDLVLDAGNRRKAIGKRTIR
jgi:hypothetical protein